MNDELEKYFAGTLSATEKTEFLNKLRDNPEAKKEFARMKAVWAVSGLLLGLSLTGIHKKSKKNNIRRSMFPKGNE